MTYNVFGGTLNLALSIYFVGTYYLLNTNTYYAVLTGCEDCQTSYVGECVKHRLQSITDKVILSRAWASLPLVLQIFRLAETADAQNAGQMTSNIHHVAYAKKHRIEVVR